MRAVAALTLVLSACVATQPVARETGTASPPAPQTAAPTTAVATTSPAPGTSAPVAPRMTEYPVGSGQGPHDVAPAADGGVWYTAQRTGELGHLDPATGATRMVKLGAGSSPHGVIVGPDGAPWVTDSGLNAIVRVDPRTSEVTRFTLPGPNVNLNTATFDRRGVLWFTGQGGVYGRLDPRSGELRVFSAPRGTGPYGIATCPDGTVYYASLAGSYVGQVDVATDAVEVLDPPTQRQGARRVWCDSRGNVWVSEWNIGSLARFVPYHRGPPSEAPQPSPSGPPPPFGWVQWKLPGTNPMAYAVYVDDQDVVWVTDFGANAIVRFDPRTERFTSLAHPAPNAAVRQLHGRPGEVWGAMSGQDKLVVVRTR